MSFWLCFNRSMRRWLCKIDEKYNVGMTIGIIVGLVIFISVIVLIWWYFSKNRFTQF